MADEAPMSVLRNQVLSRLAAVDLRRLEPGLELVQITKGQVLDEPNKPTAHLYFPESGIASVIAVDEHGRKIEVGPFGREGMSGTHVVMGVEASPLETNIQSDGTAHRIDVEALRQAMSQSASLRQRLLLYVQAFHFQTAQTLLINSYANLEQRLARWVLMAHDRTDGDAMALTHDFVSVMLGVRRAGVTEAVQMLESRKLIKATRGVFEVRDRKGLEALAGRSYGASEAEYARLMAP